MKSFAPAADEINAKTAEISHSREDFPPAHNGLSPAFRDSRTGETHLAVTVDGTRSEVHEFHHLPAAWIVERDASGAPTALHPAIVAGYHRFDRFMPLDILSSPVRDA